MFVCSLVADKTNFSSELSKCKQSKSILKVMTLVMPWLRENQKLLSFLSYCASFAHLITIKFSFFNNSTCVHRNTCKLCKGARFDEAKLLESGNPVSYTDHTQLFRYYI